MKIASNWFEKIYEDIIFDYFNITLFSHISVYYIYIIILIYIYISYLSVLFILL